MMVNMGNIHRGCWSEVAKKFDRKNNIRDHALTGKWFNSNALSFHSFEARNL